MITQKRRAANFRLADLDHDSADIRRDAARRAWKYVQQLGRKEAFRLYSRFSDDQPGTPGWKIAELCRLRTFMIDQDRGGGDVCPNRRCGRSGLWAVTSTGKVVCRCFSEGAA